MTAEEEPHLVHGEKGAYVGGSWVPIEECASKFNIEGGSGCRENCKACPRSRTRNSAAKEDGSYDVVIIGAGCIGSAIARELSKTTAHVLLVEAADDVTQGATKGNSGIVHAGYDDKPGSVKSKYCWPGNQLFPQLDKELHFGFQQNGSLVVARGPEEEKVLEELMERGKKNKVKNLRIVKQDELRKMEPYINPEATAALYSPDAGTITPYEYTIALAENAVDNGVEVRIRRLVTGIEKLDASGKKGFVVTANHWEPNDYLNVASSGAPTLKIAGALIPILLAVIVNIVQPSLINTILETLGLYLTLAIVALLAMVFTLLAPSPKKGKPVEFVPSKGTDLSGKGEEETIRCDYIVNAAGCHSDNIAKMVGDNSFFIKPRYGEYILLHKDEGHKVRHTLFPTPHPVLGKGVLVQNTLWGNLILGPTARDTLKKNEETGEYEIDPEVRDASPDSIMMYILTKCKHLIPSFDAGKVIHTFSGARSKSSTGDWIIQACDAAPGLIHAAGIDSPGIAGSPAIALDIVRLLKEAGAPVNTPNPTFNPNRAPIITPKNGYKNLKMSKTDWYKTKDPKQNVICKCEKVTEAEVIEACRRSLPIDSTQAIRKRTRAGMGHCQGDPNNYDCEARVADIISRELGLQTSQVGRRPWPASSMLSQRFINDTDRQHLRDLAAKA